MTQVCNPETGSWLACPRHRLTCTALAAFQGHEAGPGRAPSAAAGHPSQRLRASSSDSCSCKELGGRAPNPLGVGVGQWYRTQWPWALPGLRCVGALPARPSPRRTPAAPRTCPSARWPKAALPSAASVLFQLRSGLHKIKGTILKWTTSGIECIHNALPPSPLCNSRTFRHRGGSPVHTRGHPHPAPAPGSRSSRSVPCSGRVSPVRPPCVASCVQHLSLSATRSRSVHTARAGPSLLFTAPCGTRRVAVIWVVPTAVHVCVSGDPFVSRGNPPRALLGHATQFSPACQRHPAQPPAHAPQWAFLKRGGSGWRARGGGGIG